MRKFIIKQVKGISRALVIEAPQKDENGNKTYLLQTEGVNLQHMWTFADTIITNKIYSNDIYSILKTYGVEMARTAIMKEMKSVFSVYDINVDWRHLGLIADYMTFNGGYKAFNRTGMATSVSPFQKMSYESCSRFMADAVIRGDKDSMTSTSSRISVGAMVKSGTGAFDLLVPLGRFVKEKI